MKCHRVRIENPKTKEIEEVRYYQGTLYKQNRSHDIKISFEDFIDMCKASKKKACRAGFNMVCDMVEMHTLWGKSITKAE